MKASMILVAAGALAATFHAASAQAEWRVINLAGQDNISRVMDYNQNNVTVYEIQGCERNVDAISFNVERSKARVQNMWVEYANGTRDVVTIPASGNPRPEIFWPSQGWFNHNRVIHAGATGGCVTRVLVDGNTVKDEHPLAILRLRLLRWIPDLKPEEYLGSNILFTKFTAFDDAPGVNDRARVMVKECGMAKLRVVANKETDLNRVRIYFANGEVQTEEFVHNIQAGKDREIDLDGHYERCV